MFIPDACIMWKSFVTTLHRNTGERVKVMKKDIRMMKAVCIAGGTVYSGICDA